MFSNITPEQTRQQIDAGTAVFVDVRSTHEFAAGHVPEALNIPIFEPDATGQMTPNREFPDVVQRHLQSDANVIVGCQMGGRSAQAASLLVQMGYGKVSNMLGGFGGAPGQPGWATSGLPVSAAPAEQQTYAHLRASDV